MACHVDKSLDVHTHPMLACYFTTDGGHFGLAFLSPSISLVGISYEQLCHCRPRPSSAYFDYFNTVFTESH